MSLAQFLDGTILDPKNIEAKVNLPKGLANPFKKVNYFAKNFGNHSGNGRNFFRYFVGRFFEKFRAKNVDGNVYNQSRRIGKKFIRRISP